MQLNAGTILNNKYKIVRVLGHGGFGTTYEAIQDTIGLRVCIKELSSSGVREGQILSSVKSENIVRVLDYFEENAQSYLVMEYLDGITLGTYIEKYGSISPVRLFSSVKQLLSALSELHRLGLIHRDIAPDNIMVIPLDLPNEAADLKLKLFDFGTARNLGLSNYTCTLKDGYTPIEQMASGEEQGPYTDIYSLCATMYFCLTKIRPEGAYGRLLDDDLKRPSALGITVNNELENILMKGLALQSSDRYQSADDMLSAIEAVLPANPTQKQPHPKKKTNRKKSIAALCSILAAVLVFAVLFLKLNNSSVTYNPETMYKVTLTPTDEFTVAGYNESIKILEERLKLFSVNSGTYSLTENEGIITVLLNKEDFPKNEATGESYKTTDIEMDSIPEYVLRAYLTRAASLILKATECDETLNLSQTKDFSAVLTDKIPDDTQNSTITSNEDSALGTYIDISFSEDFLNENREIIDSWNNSYSLRQDIDCSPPVISFTTIPKADGSGFYLLTDDDISLINILVYNLTHEPLEHSFDISIEEQVSWQSNKDEFGEYQVTADAFSDDSDTASYYIYGSMSDGELLDNYQVIRNRLDSLKCSYSIGEMDSLSAVTSGCDAPIYNFIAIKSDDEELKYLDIANLALCSNKFLLCSEDGLYSESYITNCHKDNNSITVYDYGFSENLTDKNAKIYLIYTSGYNQTILMQGSWGENDQFTFTSFSNGENVQKDNSLVLDLIAACIENQPPAELSAYDLDSSDQITSTGLFEISDS